jgi:site-specific DNA-cytosine methylase
VSRVLLACEESQVVTIEMRKLGLEAFSCDILPCSGGHPEWHLQQDVVPLLDEEWDMLVAFPPCNDLAVSGARWFKEKQADGRQQASIEFFMRFATASCDRIAIENPIGIMSSLYRKPDQIIQPWQFGHGEVKATCLWLKNLPKLVPTNIVSGREPKILNMPDSKSRVLKRSKTYQGIAEAMANQWGTLIH